MNKDYLEIKSCTEEILPELAQIPSTMFQSMFWFRTSSGFSTPDNTVEREKATNLQN
jgi:hypothetical protein